MGGNVAEALVTLAMIAVVPTTAVVIGATAWLVVKRVRRSNER